MKHFVVCLIGFALLSAGVRSAGAQARYAATRSNRLQAGAGAMYLDTDYAPKKNYGIAAWVDYDFTRLIGVEAEAHFGGIISPNDFGETTYEIGPRLSYRKRKYNLYGKFVVGRAFLVDQQHGNYTYRYSMYGYGGGLEYKLTQKLNLRAVDVEVQKWPDFAPNTLSPLSVTVGLSYIIR